MLLPAMPPCTMAEPERLAVNNNRHMSWVFSTPQLIQQMCFRLPICTFTRTQTTSCWCAFLAVNKLLWISLFPSPLFWCDTPKRAENQREMETQLPTLSGRVMQSPDGPSLALAAFSFRWTHVHTHYTFSNIDLRYVHGSLTYTHTCTQLMSLRLIGYHFTGCI